MQLRIYQVDAFTDKVFGGNPAAVCPLEKWLDKELMQQIAAENALAETVFFVPVSNGFEIRWFTPEIEMDLCGHATLAAAHVISRHLDYPNPTIQFYSELTIAVCNAGGLGSLPCATLDAATLREEFTRQTTPKTRL